ncbi:phage tail fiber domain-containing protein [Cedecea sp. NFIX57]|uniref:phage tail fiber domain-containing protein n=1 Tax=Cedecea sp. NFIX57 TaxID=1566286 RepID=UPI000A0A998E|nr:phage tail fiber protein [Cedecea sp. NFIX57]SMG60153.1 Phage T7 tail fibre protein [Cedecea sp. NFIX57]
MSVPNQTPYIIYNANGMTTVFPFEFYIIAAGDIQVSINGTVATSGFSVSGTGNVSGGDVVFLTPPAAGSVVMLERVVPTYRLTDYQDNGDLLADTINKDFDRLWMAIQRSSIYLGLALRRPLLGGPFDAEGYRIESLADPVNEQDAATKKYVETVSLARTLRVPEGMVQPVPSTAERANKLLAFNSSGDPIPVIPASGSASDVMIELAKPTGARRIGYNGSTVADELDKSNLRAGDVVYAADYLPASYIPGADVSTHMLNIAAAVNAIPNTEHNGKPVVLEFPSGWFKHSSTLWFKRPVILKSSGDTKMEFTGSGNQIKFGPDGITFNGDGGGLDHKLHVTYGFVGDGIFTFTGNLSDDGIVFNEFITNPRLIGLRFVNYGSEDHYEIKLWGQCWDITVNNVRHTNTQSKAVNFISANGKMKDGTVDYGNSRLHIGSDVYLQIEGSAAGGICIDVGGADYRFDGVAHGWRVTHQLGAFASNPRINGYHETIYVGCESLITYGGVPEDTVVRDDGYFEGGVIGGDGCYWAAHNLPSSQGYPETHCRFMRPGRSDVVLKGMKINNLGTYSVDNRFPLVTTNIIDGRPSYGNSYDEIKVPSAMVHQQNALIQPWMPMRKTDNLVVNGSGRLSRSGNSFSFSSSASSARIFDFWEYTSNGAGQCQIYRNMISNNTEFTHEGTTMGVVIPSANADTKTIRCVLDKNAFKCQGRELTLSFMATNGFPNIKTEISVTLLLSFSSSGGDIKAYSFGAFDIGPSFGLKSFSLNIPYYGGQSSSDAVAYLVFELPKNQLVNIVLANVNLCAGNVAVQGPGELKDWDVLARSIAYYGS